MKRFLFLFLIITVIISGIMVFNACSDSKSEDEITLDEGLASIGEVTFDTQSEPLQNDTAKETVEEDEIMSIESDRENGFEEIHPVE